MTEPAPRIAPDFAIEVITDRGHVFVVPRGEIDLATVRRVQARLDELEDAGVRDIVLDLRQVTFIDSTGVTLIVRQVRKRNGFAVVPGPPPVQRVFELTGLAARIPFVTPSALPAPL